jgi:hypothetical protein
MIEKYNITAENIYNWDEKGFMIRRLSVWKRILSKAAYEQGHIHYFQQDSSREFISLLACICINEIVLSLALIYQGASNDLRSS